MVIILIKTSFLRNYGSLPLLTFHKNSLKATLANCCCQEQEMWQRMTDLLEMASLIGRENVLTY